MFTIPPPSCIANFSALNAEVFKPWSSTKRSSLWLEDCLAEELLYSLLFWCSRERKLSLWLLYSTTFYPSCGFKWFFRLAKEIQLGGESLAGDCYLIRSSSEIFTYLVGVTIFSTTTSTSLSGLKEQSYSFNSSFSIVEWITPKEYCRPAFVSAAAILLPLFMLSNCCC